MFAIRPARRIASFTLPGVQKWAPSLAIWGFGAGTAALFLLSTTPIVKGVLVNVPLLGKYYEDPTPDSDKPF